MDDLISRSMWTAQTEVLVIFLKNSKDMKLEAKNSGGSESLGKSVHEYYQSPWDKILKELINIV